MSLLVFALGLAAAMPAGAQTPRMPRVQRAVIRPVSEAAQTSQAQASPIKRASIEALEKSIDGRMGRPADDPMDLLGNTRGIYLHGYGAVFTTEVNLIISPGLSPFRQSISAEEKTRVHDRKLRKIVTLKQAMREMLLHSAQALDAVPLGEQIVYGVSLFYFNWEDTAGLPSQIVMHAARGSLLQKTIVDSAIQTEEF